MTQPQPEPEPDQEPSPKGDIGSASAPCPLRTLMERVAAGQRDALRELYDETVDLAYAVAHRILGDAAAAEDAVAETFLQIWRDTVHYDVQRGSVRGWITMISRTRALDLRRRHAARFEEELSAEQVAGYAHQTVANGRDVGGSTVFDQVDDSERLEIVQSALSRLPAEQRAAVECAFFMGLTHSEVAERLGAPLGTVKTRIRSALQELRTRLALIRPETITRQMTQAIVRPPATAENRQTNAARGLTP